MNEPLRDLMDELAGDAPEVADWSGRVRRVVVVRRRRQQVLTAAAAVAVLAVGGVTVALASAPAQPDSLVGATETSPSPVATASASAPAPEAAPTVAAAPTVQPEPSAEPSPFPTVEGAPSPATEPTFPPSGSQVIEITAQGRPDRPTVGQEWVLDVTATGSADEPYLQDACFDREPCARAIPGCLPRERSYSPPPPRRASTQRTFRHTFTTPGRHEVRLEASATCSYYQGYAERLLVVQVDEQPPPASPAPSPAPSAAPSTAASPAP